MTLKFEIESRSWNIYTVEPICLYL